MTEALHTDSQATLDAAVAHIETVPEGMALMAALEKRVSHLREEKMRKALAQIESIASELGVSPEDLLSKSGRKHARRGPGRPRTNGHKLELVE